MKKRRINFRRLLVSVSLLLGLVCVVYLGARALKKGPEPAALLPSPSPSVEPEAAPSPTPEPTPVPSPTPFNGTRSISFTFTGDIMAHDQQLDGAYDAATGTYDFTKNYDFVRDRLSRADFTIGNLETTVGGKGKSGYSGYPMFNTPETILDALKAAGFDVLTMANNHCLDRYCDGLIASVENVRKAGFLETGGYVSQEDYDSILYLEKEGMRVALFAYTDSVNRMEPHVDQTKLPYVVRRYTLERALEDIQRAKADGADAVILSIHWGKEYLREPESYKKSDAKTLAEAGADVIIGSHPHVLQPVEKIRVTRADGTVKDVLVAYSMGNFISNQREKYTDTGMMLNFTVEKDYATGKVEVKNMSYTPTWVWRFEKGKKYDYRIMPLPESLENEPRGISSENLKRMRTAWKEAKDLIGEEVIPVA